MFTKVELEYARQAVEQEKDNLKILDPGDDEQETGCVRLVESFETDEHCGLIFPLLGINLFQHTGNAPDKHLTVSQARCIISQVLKATAFIHQRGLIHADIKPDNIALTAEADEQDARAPKVSVIDLGCARPIPKEGCVWAGVVGAYAYRAPEVWVKYGWDSKVDIWAIGCVLVHLLLGYMPFDMGEITPREPFQGEQESILESVEDTTQVARYLFSIWVEGVVFCSAKRNHRRDMKLQGSACDLEIPVSSQFAKDNTKN